MRILVLALRRIAWMPPTLLGLIGIVFFISRIIPADPARVMAGENASPAQIEALRQKFGLDLPLWQQFVNYVSDVLSGNMGISLYSQRPVAEDLIGRLAATFELAIAAMVVAIAIGVPLGVVSALNRNKFIDQVIRLVTMAGLAMAAFWLAILLQLFFSMTLGITPVQGRIDGWGPDSITGFYTIDAMLTGDGEMFAKSLWYLALPTATLAIPAAATIVRFTRAGVLNALSSNFVFYQSAMGLPRRTIIWKYILRSALIGTLTQIGLVFGNLLAGAVVIETVFSWPGLGLFAYNSILQSDYNAIMAFTLFTGTVFILVNLLIDIAQTLLDPRSRA
ncbi:MAG: ABC transporter permease [Beijerinckiaceae bacterium]|nr:ABC transporter permease [Beijerinckiaceae bacterium]